MARATVCCLVLIFAVCSPSRGDILDAIAPAAVVCVGNNAPDEEKQAARLVFSELRGRSDSAVLLGDEQVRGMPVAESGKWHVIAVGRPTTNSVLLNYPSYWALDRELHYAPLGHMPAAPFTETRGFYVGGFGYFFAGHDVGFVEFDRSPFYAGMLFNLSDEEKALADPAPGLRFLVRITGSTPNGVLLAAKRFLGSRMLYGLALGPPRWPRPRDIWNLDDEKTKPEPPSWIPKGPFAPSGSNAQRRTISYLGWLMADRTMYAGFLEVAGCNPLQMWRVKYASEVGLTDFNRSPHHRASGNELLVMRLTDHEELTGALKALGGTIRVGIAGQTCYKTNNVYRTGDGGTFSVERNGMRPFQAGEPSPTYILPANIGADSYLILANFGKEHVDMIMGEVVRSLPKNP